MNPNAHPDHKTADCPPHDMGPTPAERRRASYTGKLPAQAETSAPRVPLSETTRLLLTVEEAGAALGVGRSFMYELIATGDIESVRVGRLRRVRPEDLRTYVASLRA